MSAAARLEELLGPNLAAAIRDAIEERFDEFLAERSANGSTTPQWLTFEQAAERLGCSHRDIISGAGHDACWAAKVAPATMVMCPCVDGLSHNEAEEITPDWAEKGANVLFHAVLETAGIVS